MGPYGSHFSLTLLSAVLLRSFHVEQVSGLKYTTICINIFSLGCLPFEIKTFMPFVYMPRCAHVWSPAGKYPR